MIDFDRLDRPTLEYALHNSEVMMGVNRSETMAGIPVSYRIYDLSEYFAADGMPKYDYLDIDVRTRKSRNSQLGWLTKKWRYMAKEVAEYMEGSNS